MTVKKSLCIIGFILILAALGYILFALLGSSSPKNETFQNEKASNTTILVPPNPSTLNQLPPEKPPEETFQEIKKAAPVTSATHELSKLYLVKCSACHGRNGKGSVGKSIAGKTKEENLALLLRYKNNQVPNSMMRGILDNMPDSDLEKLAEEVATFK